MRKSLFVFYGFALLAFAFCSTPKTSMDYYNLGVKNLYKKNLFNKKKHAAALENLYKSIMLDSENKLAYLAIGGSFENKYRSAADSLDMQNARSYYEKALRIDSNYAEAYFRVGYTYLTEAHQPKLIYTAKMKIAEAYFSKVIALDSTFMIAYAERAECYHYLGDTAGRNADWQKACSLGNSVACWQLQLERSRAH